METHPQTTGPELAAHEITYHRFMLGVKWFGIHLAALVAFLVLWFATPTGFWGAFIVGLVIVAAGVYAMAHGLARSSEGGASASAQAPNAPPH